jgi:pyrroline-5-carboxylate reductase
MNRANLLLVGCGHLGQALLRRWLAAGAEFNFTVIKPTPLPPEFSSPHLRWLQQPSQLETQPDVILYAVRPQQLSALLPAYQPWAAKALNIAVAAGWPMQRYAALLGEDCALIRTMPNLPAQIGQGVTPSIANAACSATHHQIAETLFTQVGQIFWLKDEAQMEAATALSGCGPAYLFLLAASMRQVGIELGLPDQLALDLTRGTLQGAGNYLAASVLDPETLCRNVQSPNGATAAAMTRLISDQGMLPMMRDGMKRAADRAKALAKES